MEITAFNLKTCQKHVIKTDIISSRPSIAFQAQLFQEELIIFIDWKSEFIFYRSPRDCLPYDNNPHPSPFFYSRSSERTFVRLPEQIDAIHRITDYYLSPVSGILTELVQSPVLVDSNYPYHISFFDPQNSTMQQMLELPCPKEFTLTRHSFAALTSWNTGLLTRPHTHQDHVQILRFSIEEQSVELNTLLPPPGVALNDTLSFDFDDGRGEILALVPGESPRLYRFSYS